MDNNKGSTKRDLLLGSKLGTRAVRKAERLAYAKMKHAMVEQPKAAAVEVHDGSPTDLSSLANHNAYRS